MAVCEELGIALAPRSPVNNDFHRHIQPNSTGPPTGAARCRAHPLNDADDRTLWQAVRPLRQGGARRGATSAAKPLDWLRQSAYAPALD
jgi:aryl-alcohol dehydrogenase-like predicted oxidoreductase